MRILNVGCGNDTYGTDFVDLYPSRKDVKKVDLDLEKLPYADGIFDEVYARAIFEHLRNPLNFLQEARRVLKLHGKIIIITDNAHFLGYHTLSRMHDGNYIGRVGDTKKLENDGHFAFFTPSHLHRHLESAGFKNVRVDYLKNWNPYMPFDEFILINIAYFFSHKHGSAHLVAEALK